MVISGVGTVFIKYVVEGNVEGTRRQGRRRKQLLNELKETPRYWKLKEEAIDRTVGVGGVFMWKSLWTG